MNRVKTVKRKYPEWVFHVAGWLVVCAFHLPPALILPVDPDEMMTVLLVGVPSLICSFCLFYFNYLFLVGRFWTKRRYAAFILLNAAAIILCVAFHLCFYKYICEPVFSFSDVSDDLRKALPYILSFPYIPTGLLVIVISSFLRISRYLNQSQAKVQELETVKMQAELEELKSQIDPHFLFNSLNAIYALIDMDSEKAQEATHALSNLLRYVLKEKNEDMVPLKDELQFTRDYIDLMSLRFSNAMLSLKVEMPDKVDGYLVAPLVFISLVENAFKHGISNARQSFILVLIYLEDNSIKATISNSLFMKSDDDRRAGGIGLDNLKRRLELIYGGEASMTVTKADDAYTTKLVIPLKYENNQNSGSR